MSKQIATLGDDKLADLFERAFREAVDDRNVSLRIGEATCDVLHAPGEPLRMRVQIYSMAGDHTRAQIHDKSNKQQVVEPLRRIVLQTDSGQKIPFCFEGSDGLGDNDYVLTYVHSER
jgi:hypothetical protein